MRRWTATESDDTGTAGWTVVVSQPRTVDLMQLTDISEVIGQKTMDAGRYTQIRLKIDSGTITVDGTEYHLEVPSGVLKLNRGFVLAPNETLKLTLDFNVEKSVIRTGSDQYKLKPVIAVLSETLSGMSEQEQVCLRSGGTVTTRLCCNSVKDFPDLCMMGACGCAPGNSHQIKVCTCGSGMCFNGTGCAAGYAIVLIKNHGPCIRSLATVVSRSDTGTTCRKNHFFPSFSSPGIVWDLQVEQFPFLITFLTGMPDQVTTRDIRRIFS